MKTTSITVDKKKLNVATSTDGFHLQLLLYDHITHDSSFSMIHIP